MEDKVTYSPNGLWLLWVVLLILKLAGVVNWSWWIVNIPLIIMGVGLIFFLIFVVVFAYFNYKSKK